MFIRLLSLMLVFIFQINLLAAQSTTADFDSLYATQLQNKLTQLGSNGNYQGLSAAVLVPGQGIWTGTYGLADNNTPLQTDMLLGIASNSKALTAALVLKLQDADLLHLDDPISDYLPDYPNVDGSITIRMLLNHTSGLFDFINDWSSATQQAYNDDPNNVWTLQELVNTLGPPVFPVGTQHSYSNTNFLLAGMVAEAAGGQTINQLLHQYIFDPLDLQMAYPPGDNPFSQPFSNLWNSTGNSTSLNENGSRTFLTFPASAGAVWATPYDMVRWYDALFGPDFLSSGSQHDLRDNDGYIAYSTGIRLRNQLNRSLYYHAGAWGFRSYMVHDPSTGISLCLISNQYGTSVTSSAFELLEEAFDQRPADSYDLAITELLPNATNCIYTNPFVILKNQGTEIIEQFQLAYGFDGDWLDTIPVILENGLAPNAQTFLPIDYALDVFSDGQKHSLQVMVMPEEEESQTANNFRRADFRIPAESTALLPYLEDFEENLPFPSGLISLQYANILDWKTTSFAASSGQQSLARINYYDANIAERYAFDLPLLQLGQQATQLSFDYAHANYPGVGREDLRTYISTDCGQSFNLLFELIGNDLSTAVATTDLFLAQVSDWETYTADLSDYINESVIIRFELENQFGNLTFIDNIRVDFLTAISELSLVDYKLSPNPACGTLYLQWPEQRVPLGVSIVNSLGQVVQTYTPEGVDNFMEIHQAQLPAAHYWLRLQTAKGELKTIPFVFQCK